MQLLNPLLLQFGLHYDDIFKSGLLANITVKRLLFKNSSISIDGVFGDKSRYYVNYFIDNGYIPGIGHLNALEIFCDLLVEYDDLSAIIRRKGRSYQSIGRSGTAWKLYPEVTHLKSVQHQINVYMKQLGLTLRRDESGLSDAESREWD
jgi:hypothetical protein